MQERLTLVRTANSRRTAQAVRPYWEKKLRKLSLEQLTHGRLKALQNAIDLINDAECLYKEGRWARSAFLSQIAIEELGKYLMIMGAIGNLIAGQIEWSKFWKRFVSHREKAGNIFLFDAALSPSQEDEKILRDFEKADTHTTEFQKQKLSSLYVDFQGDRFVLPMDVVDEKTAKKAIENAKAVLFFFELGEKEVFSKENLRELSASTLERIRDEVSKLSTKLKEA
jgi:AbiV family abortive infection protein